MKTGETRQPLAVCKLTVGDIYLSILHFYAEQLAKTELNLSEDITNNTNELFNPTLTSPSVGDRSAKTSSVIIPAPQEYSLFRPPRKTRPAKESISVQDDFFETIGAELASIQKAEEDARSVLDTESLQSDSDSSFLGGGAKTKDEGNSSLANGSERLFGSISLSFFPVPW